MKYRFLTRIVIATLLAVNLMGCATKESAESQPVVQEATAQPEQEQASIQEPEQVQEEIKNTALKELCSKYFTLGVGINGSTLENQTLNIPQYMELSKKHFNSCTMTNLMKSCYILNQEKSKENLLNGDPSPALSFDSIIQPYSGVWRMI